MTTTDLAPEVPEAPARKGNRYVDALRHRDLRLMIIAFVIDETCSWSYSVVLAAYVFDRTGSPGWVAAILATRWITGMIIGAPAGVIADRYERIRLVQVGAVCSSAVMVGMTVVVASDGPLALLIVLGVLATIAGSANRPAVGAVIPEVVPEKDLAAANGLFAGIENVVVVLGPAIGGLLLVATTASLVVGINAASFLVSAAIFSLVRARSRGSAERGGGMLRQLGEGWHALRGNRTVFILVVFLVLDSAVFGAASVVFGPLSEHLGTGANGYSYLIATNAAGGVIGAIVADRLAARPKLSAVIIVSLTVESVPLALTSFTTSPVVAGGLQVITGIGMVIVDVVAITAMQREISGDLLGRVTALAFSAILAGNVVASFAATAVLEGAGLTPALIAIGIAFPVVGALLLPPLIRVERTTSGAVTRLEPRVAFVSSLDLFTGAPRSVLEQLAAAATERHLEPGEVIITQGEPADALYLLEDGTLAVDVRAESGRVNERPDVQAPGYVGELGLLRRIPRTATVRARTAATVLRIGADDFFSALSTASASRSMLTLAGERFARYSPPSPAPIDTADHDTADPDTADPATDATPETGVEAPPVESPSGVSPSATGPGPAGTPRPAPERPRPRPTPHP